MEDYTLLDFIVSLFQMSINAGLFFLIYRLLGLITAYRLAKLPGVKGFEINIRGIKVMKEIKE